MDGNLVWGLGGCDFSEWILVARKDNEVANFFLKFVEKIDCGFGKRMMVSRSGGLVAKLGEKCFVQICWDVQSREGKFLGGWMSIRKNPQSMDGMFIAGMDMPARDEWFLPEISLGQGVWMRFEGWEILRGGRFQSGVFNNQALQRSRTSRADERRVIFPVPSRMACSKFAFLPRTRRWI